MTGPTRSHHRKGDRGRLTSVREVKQQREFEYVNANCDDDQITRTPVSLRHKRATAAGSRTGRCRPLRVLQVFGALILLAGAALAFSFAGTAGAGTGPGASGNTITTAAQAQQPFTAGTPFDSGQVIDVVVPPNSVLTPGNQLYILECAAPGGVNPTTTGSCDGTTGYAGGTIYVNGDGSVDVMNDPAGSGIGYPVYALPDHYTLGEPSSASPKCGLGTANECVLYIGQGGGSDIGMSQPHFFSQAFQVHTDSTDSGALSPGDGSPEPATAVSPTNSTVTPATQTVTADGADPAVVTVTLKDQSSVGVQGRTVSLAPSGHAKVASAAPGSDVTDVNGQATYWVTDASAESVTLTATDVTDGIGVTETVQGTFVAPTINQAASGVFASPTTVPSDGTTPSTVTVTIKDDSVAPGSPAPIPGLTVHITAGGGSSVISSSSAITDASGVATFSVTDATTENVTYQATTGATALTSTATVHFGTAPTVSATKSTVTAPTPVSTGPSNGTTVTVTLLASDGTTTVPDKTVNVTASGGSAVVTTEGTGATNASGQALFTVYDNTAESVTMIAKDTTDGIVLASAPVVVFQTPPPPTISATLTTVQIANSLAPADGSSAASVTVTVMNTANAIVPGVTVSVAPSPTGTASVVAVAGQNATNSNGVVNFYVRDTAAQTVTLTASVVGGITFKQTVTATFTAGSPDANRSTVSASQLQVPADGATASTVTVAVTDYFGNPVASQSITLKPAGGSSVYTPVQVTAGITPGITNAQGVARFSAIDATSEVVTYSATDTTDSLILTQLASVTFGKPPVVIPVQADSGAVANLSTDAADGKSAARVTVELRDANGYPVTGKTVSLTASGGSSVIAAVNVAGSIRGPLDAVSAETATTVGPMGAPSPVTAVSNSNGNAVFAVTDTVLETVTYTAADTTDSISGWTVSMTFTAVAVAASPTTTTTSTTTSTTVPTSTTTTPGSTAATDTSGGSSATGNTTASGPSLAFTGAPASLPWIYGIGALLFLFGFFGRTILAERRRKR